MDTCHNLLPDLYAIPALDEADAAQQLKVLLQKNGVNRRGWRLYLDYGDALLESLGSKLLNRQARQQSCRHVEQVLSLLAACEMDVPPPRDGQPRGGEEAGAAVPGHGAVRSRSPASVGVRLP